MSGNATNQALAQIFASVGKKSCMETIWDPYFGGTYGSGVPIGISGYFFVLS